MIAAIAPNYFAGFRERVEMLSGENVFACYQCGMCTAGCTFTDEMDLLPHQVIRQLQLNNWKALESNAKWICASCLNCQTRCPKGVDLSKIMEAMRQIYLRRQLDHIELNQLTVDQIRCLPQIALVASFRKKTG
jgi:heterodisulfide reductase subunit C